VRLPDNLLLHTVSSLLSIGVIVGLIYDWTGYAKHYAQGTESWHLGESRLIEVTVVRDDKERLACSSDVVIDGLHCGHHSNGQPFEAHTQADSHVLSPFNTVKNELFLGAGLWTSPVLHGSLPSERFTVTCHYKKIGDVQSAGLRWALTEPFDTAKQSLALGTLTDCVIP